MAFDPLGLLSLLRALRKRGLRGDLLDGDPDLIGPPRAIHPRSQLASRVDRVALDDVLVLAAPITAGPVVRRRLPTFENLCAYTRTRRRAIQAPMRIIDVTYWLDEHGQIPTNNLRLRRQVLRVAQFIESGGPLEQGEFRETLVPCRRRPDRRDCLGLMWVTKNEDDSILSYCLVCKTDEALISGWQDTDWADGPMGPESSVAGAPGESAPLN